MASFTLGASLWPCAWMQVTAERGGAGKDPHHWFRALRGLGLRIHTRLRAVKQYVSVSGRPVGIRIMRSSIRNLYIISIVLIHANASFSSLRNTVVCHFFFLISVLVLVLHPTLH